MSKEFKVYLQMLDLREGFVPLFKNKSCPLPNKGILCREYLGLILRKL